MVVSAADLPRSLQKNTEHPDDKTKHRDHTYRKRGDHQMQVGGGKSPTATRPVCCRPLCENPLRQQRGPHRPEQSRPLGDHNGNRRGSAFPSSGREQGLKQQRSAGAEKSRPQYSRSQPERTPF